MKYITTISFLLFALLMHHVAEAQNVDEIARLSSDVDYHWSKKNYEVALSLIDKCIKLGESDAECYRLIDVIKKEKFFMLEEYASTLRNSKEYTKALNRELQAIEFYNNSLPKNDTLYVGSLLQLSLIYYYLNDCSNLIKTKEEEIKIKTTKLGIPKDSLIDDLNSVALYYYKLNRYSEALTKQLQVVALARHNPKAENKLGAYLNHLATFYARLKDYKNALKYEKESCKYYKRQYGESSSQYKTSIANIEVYRSNIYDK